VSIAGFMTYFATVVLKRARCDILEAEAASGWVRESATRTSTQPRNS
jgi:hypothetical protein